MDLGKKDEKQEYGLTPQAVKPCIDLRLKIWMLASFFKPPILEA